MLAALFDWNINSDFFHEKTRRRTTTKPWATVLGQECMKGLYVQPRYFWRKQTYFQQEEQTLRRLTFECKTTKILLLFHKPRHLTDEKHVHFVPWTHTRIAQFILCMNLMYVATIWHLNNTRQESKQVSKKHNLQFIFLTHLWPWNKVKVINSTMKM